LCLVPAALCLGGCAPAPTHPQPPQAPAAATAPEGRPVVDPAADPTVEPAAKPAVDPNLPFTRGKEGSFLRPPYAPPELDRLEATMGGSIHGPDEGGAFFRRPEFGEGENDGRLYYTRYLAKTRDGKTLRWGYVTWRPLNSPDEMAQRFMPLPGHTVEDFQTDGKFLIVYQCPNWPSKAATQLQHYRWEGTDDGRGRFVLAHTEKGDPVY
jgi:hypothetical protein